MNIGTSSNLRGSPAHKSAENRDVRAFSRSFAYFAHVLHVFAEISCADLFSCLAACFAKFCGDSRRFADLCLNSMHKFAEFC